MIWVSPITRVADTVAAADASHLVTLLNAGTPFERPQTIGAERHLFLAMNDIVTEHPDLVAPGREHVERLIAFARGWNRARPLVINCFAGVSRSTASAFIVAAALAPERDEMELARTLRRLSPSATPNTLLVSHADVILDRGGRMVAAVEAIGRGADCFENTPFGLPISPD